MSGKMSARPSYNPRCCCVVLIIASILCLASCASRYDLLKSPPATLSPVVDATFITAPPDVDPVLWSQLRTELERVLAQHGSLRHSAGVPAGKGSVVPDLHTYASGINSVYEWSYRQHGDYDLNGTVNISDLLPIGIHYGKNMLSPDWQQAQLADGDINGVINVGDVTAIGLNWNGRVDGYELQWRQTAAEPWVVLANAAFVAGDPSSGLYPQYQKFTAFNAPGPDYRVVPYFDDGTGRQYGTSSNVIGSLTIQGCCWNTARADTAHDGFPLLYGPDNPELVWTYNLAGETLLSTFNEPVSDYTGTIYVGTAMASDLTSSAPGYLYALTMDGKLRWRLQTSRSIVGSPSCSDHGRVITGDLGGAVYCFAPDGKQLWRRQLSGAVAMSAPLIGSDDMVYILAHTITSSDISSSTLYKLDEQGTIVWSRDLSSICLSSPFFDADGNVTVVNVEGQVTTYKPDGAMWFQFSTGSVMTDYPYARGAAERSGALCFATKDLGLRTTAYNNTSSSFFDLAGEQPLTMPCINLAGDYAIGTLDTTPTETCKLNYISGGAEMWEITLPGNHLSNIAIDLNSRMYLATCLIEQGEPGASNGVHCVWQDQTKAWTYQTGASLPISLALVGPKELAILAISSSGLELIGISGN